MLRQIAQDAIRRWHHEFGLAQKSLASIVGVSDGTISRCLNEPEWHISNETLHKIIDAIEKEASHRLIPFEMTVLAYCHDQAFHTNEAANEATIFSIKGALKHGSCECNLPAGCRGALVRIGGPNSRMFLVVLSHATTDDEKRALAHELEHIRDLILHGLKGGTVPPRSSF